MKPRLTQKQQHWLGHLEAYRESGLSMRAYAEANGLNATALYSWKATLQRKGALGSPAAADSQRFHRVKLIGTDHRQCSVVLPNGLRLEVGGGVEPAWVAELVQALS